MSNKPKGVTIHPQNRLSYADKAYTQFVHNIKSYCLKIRGFGKHIGSKSPNVLKQYLNRF